MSGDNMKMVKKVVIRCVSVFLMVFAVIFSFTFRSLGLMTWENGFCLGDEILTGLGLKAWSNGVHGTHYTVLYSLGMLLIAFLVYAWTTRKKFTNFIYFLGGFSVIFFLANIVN